MEMGLCIKQRRQQLGLTQQEVADECGVDRSSVCLWEKGNPMKMDKVPVLARVLQLEPGDLYKKPPENGFLDRPFLLPESETDTVRKALAHYGKSSISVEEYNTFKASQPSQLSKQETELLALFRQLHPIDRNRIMKMVAIMADENIMG